MIGKAPRLSPSQQRASWRFRGWGALSGEGYLVGALGIGSLGTSWGVDGGIMVEVVEAVVLQVVQVGQVVLGR